MASTTKEYSTAHLLLELNRLKPTTGTEELNELFKSYVNEKDTSIHSVIIHSANEITKLAQQRRSTIGLEKHINGAIIGLELVKKSFARSKEDLSKVDAQIHYLSQFIENFNTTALLEDIAKAHPELAVLCKDPEIFKDFITVGKLFGYKQPIPISTGYLLLNMRVGDPKLFRNLILTLQNVYQKNQELLKQNVLPDIKSDYNVKARDAVKDALNNLYMLDMLGVERSKHSELVTFLFATLERVVPTDVQARNDLMLLPINPTPTPHDSTYRPYNKIEEAKRSTDKKIAALNEELNQGPPAERVKVIKAEIKLQEKLRGYYPSSTTGIYQTIQWKRTDPKLERWEHTIGFQSASGQKKESVIVLDLGFLGELKPETRRLIFELISLCNQIPGDPGYWLDEFQMHETIPTEVQERLNAIPNLSEEQRMTLLKAILDFNYKSNLAFFVNLSTFAE